MRAVEVESGTRLKPSRVAPILYLWLALGAAAAPACAQTAPWSAPVRGSWVQTGPAAEGDVVLAAKGSASEIVVSADENPAVRQAAEFLAGDIEKISGYRPPIVQAASGDRSSLRLVTLGHGELPPEVDAAALQGQWESYRIATVGRAVWLVGSNPRGTAFAACTLSERLGVDHWYRETWIRAELRRFNPHRSYSQLRAFIASEGHGRLARAPQP